MSSDDDQPDRPRVDQPLHGPRKPAGGPALLTLVVLLAVVAIIALIIWTRYNT